MTVVLKRILVGLRTSENSTQMEIGTLKSYRSVFFNLLCICASSFFILLNFVDETEFPIGNNFSRNYSEGLVCVTVFLSSLF